MKKEKTDQEAFATMFKIKKVSSLLSYRFVKEKKQVVPYRFARENYVLPVDEDEKYFYVAICDPLNVSILTELKVLLQKKIEPLFCAKEKMQEALEKCYEQKVEETQKIITDLSQSSSKTKIKKSEGFDLLERTDKDPVVRLLNAIVTEAIQQGASDIHFEPQEDGLEIRFRIDGVLHKKHQPSSENQKQIITRIKVMAKMDIAEQRLPQDGRIKLNMGERAIDFRVSTLPTVYGERVVLRILDRSNLLLGLDHIGMKPSILTPFRHLIGASEGIVLVTGPTGSGKTTTLYSALMEILTSEKNIMTIEDPVEYKLPRIAQMHVNPKIGLTFHMGLRHILRQDPDVIMIGEIRDKETAEIAIQSALTGHLVFSTLHTNNAPSAITRLAEMGIEPYLLSSSILGVLAQRLVRKICPHCKEKIEITEKEKQALGISTKTLYRGKGCDSCFGSGYMGRLGIYEFMPIDAALKRAIIKSVDAQSLEKVAIKEGMQLLSQNAWETVEKGISTLAEVVRVTNMDKAQ